MTRLNFDREFDRFVAGVLDGASGGRLKSVRSHVRAAVDGYEKIRPFVAESLRELADRLDPPQKNGTMNVRGRRERARRG